MAAAVSMEGRDKDASIDLTSFLLQNSFERAMRLILILPAGQLYASLALAIAACGNSCSYQCRRREYINY